MRVRAVDRSWNKLPSAEQVEIGGVYVMRIVEALARFAQAGPAVFDAGQSSLIKCGGTSASSRARRIRE